MFGKILDINSHNTYIILSNGTVITIANSQIPNNFKIGDTLNINSALINTSCNKFNNLL